MTTFGAAVREARKRRGMKQKELARLVGTTPEYLCCVERGTYPGGPKLRQKIIDVLAGDELLVAFQNERPDWV